MEACSGPNVATLAIASSLHFVSVFLLEANISVDPGWFIRQPWTELH